MILVLTGTNLYPFTRLIQAADDYAANSKEEVIIQTGYSTFESMHARTFRFCAHSEIIDLIKEASVVVLQGGYGSIYDCLLHKKKIVAVPRKNELNESSDPGLGQFELVQYLEKKKSVLAVYDIADLPSKINEARSFDPNLKLSKELPRLVSDILKKN